MDPGRHWRFVAIVAIGLSAIACTQSSVTPAKVEAVVVETIEGSDLKRLTLSEKAAGRLGIATAPVSQDSGGAQRTVIPYSAVIYARDGTTWAYTNPNGLTFVRSEIAVDHIAADRAVLIDGPPVGTLVVIVGAAELWGVETGVGGGH